MAERFEIVAAPEDKGARLDRFLSDRMGVTRSTVERLLSEGAVTVLGGDAVLLLGEDDVLEDLKVLEGVVAVHVVAGHDRVDDGDVGITLDQTVQGVQLAGNGQALLAVDGALVRIVGYVCLVAGNGAQGSGQKQAGQNDGKNPFHGNILFSDKVKSSAGLLVCATL